MDTEIFWTYFFLDKVFVSLNVFSGRNKAETAKKLLTNFSPKFSQFEPYPVVSLSIGNVLVLKKSKNFVTYKSAVLTLYFRFDHKFTCLRNIGKKGDITSIWVDQENSLKGL